jgi:hypothetical protein
MSREAQSIEVEVVEIDGATQPATSTRQKPAPPPRQWQNLHGRIRMLNNRWWPLWVILGVIVVSLALTFGVLFGIALLLLRMIQRMFRALIR